MKLFFLQPQVAVAATVTGCLNLVVTPRGPELPVLEAGFGYLLTQLRRDIDVREYEKARCLIGYLESVAEAYMASQWVVNARSANPVCNVVLALEDFCSTGREVDFYAPLFRTLLNVTIPTRLHTI